MDNWGPARRETCPRASPAPTRVCSQGQRAEPASRCRVQDGRLGWSVGKGTHRSGSGDGFLCLGGEQVAQVLPPVWGGRRSKAGVGQLPWVSRTAPPPGRTCTPITHTASPLPWCHKTAPLSFASRGPSASTTCLCVGQQGTAQGLGSASYLCQALEGHSVPLAFRVPGRGRLASVSSRHGGGGIPWYQHVQLPNGGAGAVAHFSWGSEGAG